MQRMLVVPGPLTTAQWIATVAGTAARRASTAAIEHYALTGGNYVLNTWYCIRVALTPYHLLTCQHRCSTSWLIFPLAMWHCWHTCWNTQCLLQLGVPHKVLDCIRCFGWEIRSLQNFARIDFKLISRPQYPLPKLSPPSVVTANYEQLLPTIWEVESCSFEWKKLHKELL
jgi:hypothetical protein